VTTVGIDLFDGCKSKGGAKHGIKKRV
jgi:hypothetical protein